MKMKKPRIPSTDSIEEFARFWETHDATDFEDEVTEMTEPVFVRKTGTVMTIRLEPQEVAAVEEIAKAKGVERSKLIQEWVREKLHES